MGSLDLDRCQSLSQRLTFVTGGLKGIKSDFRGQGFAIIIIVWICQGGFMNVICHKISNSIHPFTLTLTKGKLEVGFYCPTTIYATPVSRGTA